MLIRNKKGEVKEIIYDERQLYNYGINRISSRDYGRQELVVKMKRLQPDLEMINKVLDKLQSQGYISDESRARSLFNQFDGKESINKTIQRILKIGISRDTIDDVVEQRREQQVALSPDDEFDEDKMSVEVENALELLGKKFRFYDFLKKDKMVRFLASKGYKYDSISKAIKHFSNEESS